MFKNNFLFTLMVAMISFASCTNDYDSALTKESAELNTRSFSVDSVDLNPIIQLEGERKIDSTGFRSSSSNALLNSNLRAMGDLRFYLKARSGNYLSTNAIGQALTVKSEPDYRSAFYAKILPATSGIPYLIYSSETNTPICVGSRADTPNDKVLFALQREVTSMMGASWDLLDATKAPGYFVIENQDYLTNGTSGNWWDVYKNVIEVKSGNTVGFGKYSQNTKQEFEIIPANTFTLRDIKYIEGYTNAATLLNNLAIKRSYVNTSQARISYDLKVEERVNESSSYKETPGIAFDFINKTMKSKRPSVLHGKIGLIPSENMTPDAPYSVSSNISTVLSATLPLSIPARSKIDITYYYRAYSVTANYEATIVYGDKEMKIRGVWTGVIHVDELPSNEHLMLITNIDTGETKAQQMSVNRTKSERIIL